MQFDLERFDQLRRAVVVETATRRGIVTQLYELDGLRSEAAAALARLDAHIQSARSGRQTRVDADALIAAHDRSLQAARDAVARIDAEREALRQREDELSRRIAPLQELEQKCRMWARRAGVTLPDAEQSATARIAAGPPGREFGSGRGAAEPPPVPHSAAAGWGAPPSARRLPAGVSFDMNSRMFNDALR